MEQQKLNPAVVYVLAILGLLCCCIGGVGVIFAGIAFYLAYSKLKAVELNPELYDPQSVKAMNTAKTVALVILIINVLYLIYTIYVIATTGWDVMWEDAMRKAQEIQEQNQ